MNPQAMGKKLVTLVACTVLMGACAAPISNDEVAAPPDGTPPATDAYTPLYVQPTSEAPPVVAAPPKVISTPKPPPASAPNKRCHPSYKGACLDPDASDYDCAGGSGNGPYYTGRVEVVGPDEYDLDRDGDGVGCE